MWHRAMARPKAFSFVVKQGKNQPGWIVYLTAPIMPSEQLSTFDTEEEANRWIENESGAWLARRLDPAAYWTS